MERSSETLNMPDEVERGASKGVVGPTSGAGDSITPQSDELSFREFGQLMWLRRKSVLSSVAAFLILALAYLHTATYRYTATLPVAAAQQENSNILSGMSGLASVAGISLPGSEVVSPFSLYLKSLHSRQVAEVLAANPAFMQTIFADQWDGATGRWRAPSGVMRSIVGATKAALGFPAQTWQPPGAAEMQGYLADNVDVDKDTQEAFATLKFKHPDPEFAKGFLTAVHMVSDEYLRERALRRTDETIRYLSTKLQTVTVAEHREALVTALSSQEKMRMNAASDAPYAAEPFGSAASSVAPTTPRPLVILLFALFSGLVVGCGIVLALQFRRAAP